MANIDFVIGGKDQASPAIDKVAASLQRLEKASVVVAAIGAAIGAAFAAVGGIKAANEAYDELAESSRKLTDQLERANQQAVSDDISKLGDNLERIVGISKDVTNGLVRQASAAGVHASQLDDITIAAAGLSEAIGQDVTSAMGMLTQATEGNFAAFEELIPSIKFMRTEQEKLAAVQALASSGLDDLAASMETPAGRSREASLAMGRLAESIGAVIAPLRLLVNEAIARFADSITHIVTPVAEMARASMESMGEWADWLGQQIVKMTNGAIYSFTAIEVVIRNLDQVWIASVAFAELQIIRLVESVKHAFTEVIPAHIQWFSRNWQQILHEAMAGAYMIVSDAITRIRDAFYALWDFITSWGDSDIMGAMGEIAGRAWLDGFRSELEKLPEVAARQITDAEKRLQSVVGQVTDNLMDQISDKYNARKLVIPTADVRDLQKQVNLALDPMRAAMAGNLAMFGGASGGLRASESRLLTRGSGDRRQEQMEIMIRLLQQQASNSATTAANTQSTAAAAQQTAANTANNTQLVPTS